MTNGDVLFYSYIISMISFIMCAILDIFIFRYGFGAWVAYTIIITWIITWILLKLGFLKIVFHYINTLKPDTTKFYEWLNRKV